MDAGTILAYLAQAAIFYAAGYLFYKIFMAKIKQPSLNRLALITIYIGSLIAPLSLRQHPLPDIVHEEATSVKEDEQSFIEGSTYDLQETDDTDYRAFSIQSDVPQPVMGNPDKETEASIPVETEARRMPIIGASAIKIMTGISVAGTLLAIFLLIFDLGKIMMLKHFGEERRMGHMKIYHVQSRNFSPFSFLNWMFLSSIDSHESEDMIIAHEMGHIRHYHWLDLMIMRACATLMWWNPLVWLLGRELRTVHEFQADTDVLNRGHNVGDYQILLLRKAAAYNMSPISSHFAQSCLKRRFIMMRRTKAGKLASLRIASLGAAFFAAAYIIGTQSIQAAIERLRDVSFDESIALTPEVEKDDTYLQIRTTDESAPDTLHIMSVLTDEASTEVPSHSGASSLKTTDTTESASEEVRTVTVHDEDSGTTYTYTYRDGNLVNREVRSANSLSNSSSMSSSQSYSSSEEKAFKNGYDIGSNIAAIMSDEDETGCTESTDFSDISILQNLSGLYTLQSLENLGELSELKNLELDMSCLQDIASNVHTYTDNDGSEVIIINGKDTTFIWRETPTSIARQQELARQRAKLGKEEQKILEKAAKEQAKTVAESKIYQILNNKILKEAAKEREKAQKEYKQQIKEAKKQIEEAQKQIEEANRQVEAANRQIGNFATIEGSVSRTSSGNKSGVLNFNNYGRKTSITVQIADLTDFNVKSIRVRYNGKWHDIQQWNCNTNGYPSGSLTRIDITGPYSTKFHTDDIIEITTDKHGKIIYKIYG